MAPQLTTPILDCTQAEHDRLKELEKDLFQELDHAEQQAWDALARYKFMMFGYWAAIWVHLNRTSKARRENPWTELVRSARGRKP